MKSKIEILNREIDRCTTEMEMWYPELFQYLDETPISSATETNKITEADLKNYLQSLRSQMDTYSRTHSKSTKA